MLGAGTYHAIAKSGVLGLTKTGREQVAVEFEVVDAEWAGQKLVWYGYFTEKTEKRTLESLRLAGWKGSDLSDLSDLSAQDVPTVQLVVEVEEYEGRAAPRVRWVNGTAGGSAVSTPLDDQQRKSFAARMKARVLAFDQESGAPPPKAKVPAPRAGPLKRGSPAPAPDPEDIPF
jgi:hypothetical protein